MTSYDHLPFVEAELNYLAPMAERPSRQRACMSTTPPSPARSGCTT